MSGIYVEKVSLPSIILIYANLDGDIREDRTGIHYHSTNG